MPGGRGASPPRAWVHGPEISTFPAGDLLGFSDSPPPPQRTATDPRPAATANIEPSSAPPGPVPAEDVIELDPSEVTLLDAEAPEPIARAPEPEQPPIAAETPDDGEIIDLSTAEAIDTGEFPLPETPSDPPPPRLPARPAP